MGHHSFAACYAGLKHIHELESKHASMTTHSLSLPKRPQHDFSAGSTGSSTPDHEDYLVITISPNNRVLGNKVRNALRISRGTWNAQITHNNLLLVTDIPWCMYAINHGIPPIGRRK